MGRKYFRSLTVILLILALSLGATAGCGEKESQEESVEKKETVEADRVVQAEEIEAEDVQEEESAPPETVPQIPEELNMQLQNMIGERQALGEKWSVYVEDLSSGANTSVGNRQMESASLIKLFTAVTVFQNMDEVTARESYDGETLDLMRKMIRVSDNDAANTLVRRLGGGDAAAGMQKVNAFCQTYGFTETHMGRLMLDFNAQDDNYTSAENCGRLLRSIYRNELAGSDTILGFMKEQERRGKIPAGLPAGTVTANKTGELDDVENDAAIVFAGTKDYIICVMSGQLTDTYAARNKIIEISGTVFQYMTNF